MYANGALKNHLLLEGSNGTGKSSITKLLPKLTFGTDFQVLNVYGSNTVVIDEDVLATWNNFCSWCHINGDGAYIVIDEIDTILKHHSLLWQWLDSTAHQVIVIGTTNKLMAVPKAIRSRMKCLTLKPITALQMFPRAQAIMQAENVTIQSAKLLKELELIESIGDIRKYMERLELIAIGNQSMQSSSMNMSNIFNKHGMKRVK
jgi:replication-associated recombination protein RarA